MYMETNLFYDLVHIYFMSIFKHFLKSKDTLLVIKYKSSHLPLTLPPYYSNNCVRSRLIPFII